MQSVIRCKLILRLPLQVDLWAFGVTLYAIATGQFPFDSSDILEMQHATMTGKICFPSTMDPDLQAFIQVQHCSYALCRKFSSMLL